MRTYLKYEVLRTIRNRQGLIFSVVFPVVMYFLLAAPQRDSKDFGDVPGLFAPLYYMTGLLAFGGMVAVLGSGARIAAERQKGWNRQIRITPLSTRGYLGGKVLVGYLFAVLAMVLLYVAGAILDVRLDAARWVVMTLLVLFALAPIAALGVALGHLVKEDAIGGAIGGGVSLLAFLGGTWFPITGDGWFVQLCKLLPSYWLVQAGHVGLGSSLNPWNVEGWIVIAFWTVAAAAFAGWAFRRDTQRG